MPKKARCWMPVCQNDRFEFVHRLPVPVERRLKWLDAINEPSLNQTEYPSICARHFRPEDYLHLYSKSLSRYAIPSLNLKDLSQLGLCKQYENYSNFINEGLNDKACDSPCSHTDVGNRIDLEQEYESEPEAEASASKRCLRPKNSRCCMPVCQNERFEFVHRLPATVERRLKWLDAINEPSLNQLKYPSICARHFRPEDYLHLYSKSLHRHAIPSLNLKDLSQLGICKQFENYSNFINEDLNDKTCDSPCSHTDVGNRIDLEQEYESEPEAEASVSKRCLRPKNSRCCMPVCQNERFEFVHRLPATVERRLKWLDAINEPSLNQLKYPSICARHFRPEDYLHLYSKSLHRHAIPSLNLKDLSQLGICKQFENYSNFINEDLNDKTCDSPCSHTDVGNRIDLEQEYESEPEAEASASKRCKVQQSYETAEMCNQNEYLTLEDLEANLLEDDCATIEMLVEQDDKVEQREAFAKNDEVDKDESAIAKSFNCINEEDNEQIENMQVSCSAQDAEDSEVACTSTSKESNIQLNSEEIIIQHLDYAETLRLHFLWLRDFCKCSDCYDINTHARLFDVTVLKPDLRPNAASLFHDNLLVEWNDNHISKYEISELFPQHSPTTSSKISWIARHASFRDDFNALRFDNLICSSSTINTAFNRLQRSGVLLISDVSASAQQKPLMLELLLRRLFPQNYQQLIKEERSDFHHAQQLPHTNCTFLSESCGLQILGLNPASAAETLELTIVDGLNAAQQLRNSTRQTFDFLANYKIPLLYRSTEDFDFITEVPMIKLRDGELERLHFAPYQRGNMSKENLPKFCDALRKISRIIMQKQLQWKLCLSKDMIVILDNWRICWQVKKQASDVAANLDSNFKLDCVYVERKHFLSRLHCLQLDK